jgi:hypothetical protein
MSCVTDLDCPAALVCYAQASWYLAGGALYPASGCMCSTWFGWTGPTCTDFGTAQFAFMVANHMVTGLAYSFVFFSGCFCLFKLFRAGAMTVPAKRSRMSSVLVTLVQLTLAAFFCLCSEFTVGTYEYFPEEAVAPTQFSGTEKSNPRLAAAARVLFLLGTVIGLLAIVTLAISWIEVALRSEHLQKKSDTRHMYGFLVAFEVLICFANFGNLAFGSSSYLAVILYPFVIIIAALYAYGFYKMRNLLRQKDDSVSVVGRNASETHALYKQLLDYIYRLTFLMEVVLTLYVIFAVLYTLSLLHGWKETPPGQVGDVLVYEFLCRMVLLFCLLIVLHSCHRSVMRFTNSVSGAVRAKSSQSASGQVNHMSVPSLAKQNSLTTVGVMVHTHATDTR